MLTDRRTFTLSLLASGLGFALRGADKEGDTPKRPAVKPLDEQNRIAVQFTDETQRFGITATKLRDPRYAEKPKLLTRYERGESNNTVARIDTFEYMFGRESPGVGIKWKSRDGKVQKGIKSADGRKVISTLRYETERLEITQTVEIIVGEQTQLYDTALVTYQIENLDNLVHQVGLRAMIDTYVGMTDGVPILVGPTEKTAAQLVDTKLVLEKASIPGFLRALESDKLGDPNAVVADMGLRLKGCEPPDKAVICRWPQEWGASEARWDWPYQAMNEPQGREKDSCVVLYWPRSNMAKGEKRTLGYTYGLGAISDGKDGSNGMRLLTGGACAAGKAFVVTAYVKDPKDGDKAKIQLPAELKLAADEKGEQPLRTGAGQGYAQVSWRVQGTKAGKFEVTASAGDRKASRSVLVHESSLFE
jgi:endonuclease YncB( thermonuclease family)